MGRLHLIEIHDQSWCPRVLRDSATEYLEFMIRKGRLYHPIADRLVAAVKRTGATKIADLCSGGGGPWVGLHEKFADLDPPVAIQLTDLYPNTEAFARVRRETDDAVQTRAEPVDATRTPVQPGEFRTLFSSFHHFRPPQARDILACAVEGRVGVAIFEATERSAISMFASLLIPIIVLLATPFVRPFRFSRLLFTYLIPLLPLLVWFDGVVSFLRTYSPDELRALVAELDADDYDWDIGQMRSGPGKPPITYLIGTPRAAATAAPAD